MYFPGWEKPSNGEFISKLFEMLDLWVACAKVPEEVKL